MQFTLRQSLGATTIIAMFVGLCVTTGLSGLLLAGYILLGFELGLRGPKFLAALVCFVCLSFAALPFLGFPSHGEFFTLFGFRLPIFDVGYNNPIAATLKFVYEIARIPLDWVADAGIAGYAVLRYWDHKVAIRPGSFLLFWLTMAGSLFGGIVYFFVRDARTNVGP